MQRNSVIHLWLIAPVASTSIETFSRIAALHHRIVFRNLNVLICFEKTWFGFRLVLLNVIVYCEIMEGRASTRVANP